MSGQSILERALDICEAYAELSRRAPVSQIEEYIYLPEVEDVIDRLRAATSPLSDSEYTRLRSLGPLVDEMLSIRRIAPAPSLQDSEV